MQGLGELQKVDVIMKKKEYLRIIRTSIHQLQNEVLITKGSSIMTKILRIPPNYKTALRQQNETISVGITQP